MLPHDPLEDRPRLQRGLKELGQLPPISPRLRKPPLKPLALALAAVTLQACISPWPDSRGRYTAPIGGAPVISNETPYSAALRCMSGFVRQRPVRIAVGQIADYTGKTEADGSGRKVTA